jgi:apolipoprotein N-acyltransferase
VWPLAWVGLVPCLIALHTGPGRVALLGNWLAGFAFFGILLYWLGLFGWTVWALACLALSLSWLAWGIAARWLGRLGPTARTIGVAVVWCGIESARGLGQFGFTWGWLGYSQSPALPFMPVARLGGTLFLSFLIVLANSAFAEMVLAVARRERVPLAAGRTLLTLALTAAVVIGAREWRVDLGGPTQARLRVAVVQGSAHGPLRAEEVNVPLTQEERQRTLEIYQSLTDEAARERPGIIVWPESVLPDMPDRDPLVAEAVSRAASSSRAWLLAGGPYFDESGRRLNSAYLFAPSGNLVAHYDKVQLVPFGEYVPGRDWFPLVERYYNVRETDFSPGAVHHLLQAGTASIGPMICFESIFPQIAWELERKGAQVMVIITNDAWFGRTAAAEQHRQIAILRAAETGCWVVRAASTGISSFIAPDGRVVSEGGLYEQTVLCEEIGLPPEGGRRGSFGPLFSWLVLCLSCAFLIAPAALGGHRGRGRAAPPGPRRRPREQAALR